MASPISRLISYYRHHGFGATVRRTGLAAKRALMFNRMIVFCCNVDNAKIAPTDLPNFLQIERLTKYAELSPQGLQELTSFWNPKQAHRNIRERFEKGASLWLIRSRDHLAGYSWTLRGRSIAGYYFPMAQDDVQLFDFYVFPKFRGRAILWFLINHILQKLRDEGVARVFGDVAEWNRASLSFYKTIPFQSLGWARKYTVFGQTLVWWDEVDALSRKMKYKSRAPVPTVNQQPRISDLQP